MKYYEVRLVETIEWFYNVKAKDEDEAIEMVSNGDVPPTRRNISQDRHKAYEYDEHGKLKPIIFRVLKPSRVKCPIDFVTWDFVKDHEEQAVVWLEEEWKKMNHKPFVKGKSDGTV